MSTIYDRVRYPNWPVARSHPGAVGAIARLFGRETAPLKKCRVLEIGCSEGANIANMAIGAPESEFIGLDLAASAIARGLRRSRPMKRSNTGGGLACFASSAALTMAVRSPTLLATRK